ncbi:MAG: hypothetical protein GY737_17345 [Desulfobacteraceae bacterium]|nr:hypothetical protein [Desulfobacteraceae bacterium]
MEFFAYTFLIALLIFLPVAMFQLVRNSYVVVREMIRNDLKFVVKTIVSSVVFGVMGCFFEGVVTVEIITYGVLGFLIVVAYELYFNA